MAKKKTKKTAKTKPSPKKKRILAKKKKKAAKKTTKKAAKIVKKIAQKTKKSAQKKPQNTAQKTAKTMKTTAAKNSPSHAEKAIDMQSVPAVGSLVPDIQLASTSGNFSLADYRGKYVVLYFYPKDATPGCTLEGRDFSQLLPDFAKANAVVFGISRDTIASHEKFRAKENYTVHLLSDAEELACSIFGVIKEKNMYGKKVMGIERSTFLIDPQGILCKEWRKVQVEGHAQAVLASIFQ